MPSMRLVFRQLWRTRGLTLAAIGAIALGAAGTAAVATLVTAALVRPVPFPAADRLVRVWWSEAGGGNRESLSIPEIDDLSRLDAFDTVIGSARMRVVWLTDAGADRLRAEAVTEGYFGALGVTPALGRLLEPADHESSANAAIVLSHGTWQRRFAGDPEVLGQTLRTDRASYTIVGVAPPSFPGLVEEDIVEFWTPIQHFEPSAARTSRAYRSVWLAARVRPDVSVQAASEATAAFGRALAADHPDVYDRLTLRAEPFAEHWRAGYRGAGSLLGGAAGLLLLVAAANVGCLLLVRVLDRRRELAVMAALGASRATRVGMLATETACIVAAGGVVGLLLGPGLVRSLLWFSPVTLPQYVDVSADVSTLLIAVGALMAAGLVAGLAPAWAGSRVAPADVLHESGRSGPDRAKERRWTGWLIAAETALTLMLVVAGGLLTRSMAALDSLDLGFDRHGIARLALTIGDTDGADAAAVTQLYDRLTAAAAATPGADLVGLVAPTLPPWNPDRAPLQLPGLDLGPFDDGLPTSLHRVDAGFFPMLGIDLVAGRLIEPRDGDADAPRVAVVSESIAMFHGSPERAIGRPVTLPGGSGLGEEPLLIAGVVNDVAYDGLVEQTSRRLIDYTQGADPVGARFDIYLPLYRFPSRVVSIGVRTRGDEAALIEPVRAALMATAPGSAVHWTTTMEGDVALEYQSNWFSTLVVGTFSAAALLLTAIGLFAMLSHTAMRRRREMGLRLALGAPRRHVAGLVMRSGLPAVAAGVAIGLAGVALGGRLLAGLVYGVRVFDPITLGAAILVFVVVALAAGALPARRVSRVDPARVLGA